MGIWHTGNLCVVHEQSYTLIGTRWREKALRNELSPLASKYLLEIAPKGLTNANFSYLGVETENTFPSSLPLASSVLPLLFFVDIPVLSASVPLFVTFATLLPVGAS